MADVTMPSIAIFICSSQECVHFPKNGLVRPLQTGTALSTRIPGIEHDDDGDSISSRHRTYGDFTGLYWAWKNADADYYGFLSDDTYLDFARTDALPGTASDAAHFTHNSGSTLRSIGFIDDVMREVITAHDYVTARPTELADDETAYAHYGTTRGNHIEDLDTCLEATRLRFPELWGSAQRYAAGSTLYESSNVIMKRDLFDEYCTYAFTVLGIHERLHDDSHYTPDGRAVQEHLAQFLLGVYLQHLVDTNRSGIELDCVQFDDVRSMEPSPSAGTATPGLLSTGSTTRSVGKIFMAVRREPSLAGCRLVATSELPDGRPVPAKVVTSGQDHVLITSLLTSEQTVTLKAIRKGAVMAQDRFALNPKTIALASEYHTFRKDPVVARIRGCDDRELPNDVRIGIERIESDTDGTALVRGHVSYTLTGAHKDPHEYLNVITFDESGTPFDLADWVCTGDRIENSKLFPGVRTRVVGFSVRVPDASPFFVWANFPDTASNDGFIYCDRNIALIMRQQWLDYSTPVSNYAGYDSWLRNTLNATPTQLALQSCVHFATKPLYSVVVPIRHASEQNFRDMANSVLRQSYRNWELLLVNASPRDFPLQQCIDSLCRHDKRVRSMKLAQDPGAAQTLREGISAASGDFVCMLGPNDMLEPDALYNLTQTVADDPTIDMLYSDEDTLDGSTFRSPLFKTEWNPDYMYASNYVQHLLAVRTPIAQAAMDAEQKDDVGSDGDSSRFDGAEEWDLAFRAAEKARTIRHVPRVLYHVRANAYMPSDAEREQTHEAGRLAVQSHLDRMGIHGTVVDSQQAPGRFMVQYDIADPPKVSIVIPNKDAVPVLHRCLMSLTKLTTFRNYEVIVVENNSTDPTTFEYYKWAEKADSRIHVVHDTEVHGFNFSQIVNYGVAHSTGDYVLLLNNDTEVITPEWIEQMLGPCMRKDVGVVGAKLFFPDDTIQHVGVIFNSDGPDHAYYQALPSAPTNADEALLTHDVAAVTGACLLTSRSTYDAIGGFDESFTVNYNDVDFCLRVLATGARVVECTTAELHHHESVSRGTDTEGPKVIRFRKERGAFMTRWPEFYPPSAVRYDNPNTKFGSQFRLPNTGVPRAPLW